MTSRTSFTTSLAATVVAAWLTSGAAAQSYYASGINPYAGSGYGGYYGGYHTSTAAEGYLRGQAELLQARGIASLYYARALGEREAARSQYIENRRAYLEFRADQRDALALRFQQKREESRRRLELRERLASQDAVERAATSKVVIDWPAALADERYEPIRNEIEALVQVRRDLGAEAGESSAVAIRHAIRTLARQIMVDEASDRMTSDESNVVRPFVRGLAANILQEPQSSTATLTAATSGIQR